MRVIDLLRGILSLTISMITSKLTHAQPGCLDPCTGADSTQCVGNFALGSSCTVCFDDPNQGIGFACNPPLCGDPCADSNGDPIDGICSGALDTCTKCLGDLINGFFCSQPSCGTPCASDAACRGADTCKTCAGGVCSEAPSQAPSVAPSFAPSKKPSGKPSKKPSGKLTKKPSVGKSKKKMKRTKKPKVVKKTKKPKVVKKTKKPKGETKKKKKY